MAAATPAWQLVQRRARSIAADCLPQYELQFYHGTHFQCPEDAISHCVRDTNLVNGVRTIHRKRPTDSDAFQEKETRKY
jgi:hypothetical protein